MVCEPVGGVVVVGGSLSGLTFALACASHGIHTTVLERIAEQDRGGGALGIDSGLLKRVTGLETRADVMSTPFPIVTNGRKATSWRAIYEWLRNQALLRDEITLKEGINVLEVIQNAATGTVMTTDGQRIDAPMIVGADGYRSVVRCAVHPNQSYTSYAGYVLWRGLVQEADLPKDTPWPKNYDGVGLANSGGYRLIVYPVAGRDGSLKFGERQISFDWYDPFRDALLQEQNCLSPAWHVLGSLNREHIPKRVRDELHGLAWRIWPEPWRRFILHALEHQAVFATPVAEYLPERLHRGRLALIGDAAHVVSPMIRKGFVSGILDAEALAACLKEFFAQPAGDISMALQCYERKRLRDAQELVATSMKWSRAYLHEVRRQSA